MIFILTVILQAASLGTVCSFGMPEADGYIIVCDDSFYPFIYYDREAEAYRGIAAEILEEAAEDNGFQYEYYRNLKQGNADKLKMLNEEKADLFMITERTDQENGLIYSEPITEDNYSIITYSENDNMAEDIEGLSGKKLGIVGGCAAEEIIRESGSDIEYRYFNNYNEMYAALELNIIDYALQKHSVYMQEYFDDELFYTKEAFIINDAAFSYCMAAKDNGAGRGLIADINETIARTDIDAALKNYPESSEFIIDRYLQNKDDRRDIIILTFVLYAVIILLGFLYFYEKHVNGILKAQTQMFETAFLSAQIKPHFLFNALGKVMSLCYVNGEEAGVLLGNLTKYLRIIYSGSGDQQLITIEKELELTRSYAEIEKARYKDRIRVNYEVDEDCLNRLIVPLTIQPLVENAIRHGLSKKSAGGTVNVNIRRVNGYVEIAVTDDGIGISEEKLAVIFEDKIKNKGIGLSNIYKRLKSLGRGAGISISSALGTGTRAVISIPENIENEQV